MGCIYVIGTDLLDVLFIIHLIISRQNWHLQNSERIAPKWQNNSLITIGKSTLFFRPESMFWSESWMRRRPSLKDGWNVEHLKDIGAQESPTSSTEVFGDSVDDAKHTSAV
jgi:hypothetical protein